MVDTVNIYWPHFAHSGIELSPPSGWEAASFLRVGGSDRSQQGYRLTHVATGLFASGHESSIRKVSLSLPNLLFGRNGRLITSQAQLDQALAMAADIMSQIGKPRGGIERFTRVDLVWHFEIDPRSAILAHRHARHPRIRANAGEYDGQSLYWRGSGLRIRMYDKELEMIRTRGGILRVECQLQGRLLDDLLPDGAIKLNHLDFTKAYQVYRQLVLGFQPASLPGTSDIATLLATAEAERSRCSGVSIFDLWARDKSPEHVRRVQRQMAALRPEYFSIDWAQLLPVDAPPPAIEL
jgi:hypothetical protein